MVKDLEIYQIMTYIWQIVPFKITLGIQMMNIMQDRSPETLQVMAEMEGQQEQIEDLKREIEELKEK